MRLNNSTVNWGNHLVNQIQNVQDNLYNQLKYSCREFDSYRELLKKRNEEGEQYAKYKIKLEGKKEKLFNSSFNKSSKSSLTEEEKRKCINHCSLETGGLRKHVARRGTGA